MRRSSILDLLLEQAKYGMQQEQIQTNNIELWQSNLILIPKYFWNQILKLS